MLQHLGWDDAWAEAFASLPDHELLTPARVTAVHRGRVELDTERDSPLAGALSEQPVVGDWVGERDGAVRVILPRRTVLAREDGPLAANADLAILVSSLDHDLNARRLERFAALARAGGIEPLVALSKGDRDTDPAAVAEELAAELGMETLVFSVHQGWGLPALRARLLPGRTSVLVGMSGVGKSTLVNELLGEERQKTLPVRERDDRGRHATTHRELFILEDGALVIDTPGVRAPALADAEGVAETFADIEELAAGCRFADCRHDTEPGCAVRDAVSPERLASLRKLEREGLDAQERKARGRQGSKMVREALRMKGRED